MRLRIPAAFGIIFCLVASANADTIFNDFGSDFQGWTANSFSYITPFRQPDFTTYFSSPSSVSWSSSIGNPPGAISIVDPDGGAEYFSAGPSFLGNLSGYYGETLNFQETELNFGQNGNLSLADPADPLVALTNGSLVLVYDNTFTPPSTTGWSQYSVPLAPGSGWFETSVDSGDPATAQDFASVLSGVTGVYLLADWYIGTDTTGLDNVQLTPEPGTWFLLLGAGAIAPVLRRRLISRRANVR
jgi:hypothetical protein